MSWVCLSIGKEEDEWFQVKVDLERGCVMFLWQFNLFIVEVVREVNSCVLERGAGLQSVENEGS